jgi:hypothetical protein
VALETLHLLPAGHKINVIKRQKQQPFTTASS